MTERSSVQFQPAVELPEGFNAGKRNLTSILSQPLQKELDRLNGPVPESYTLDNPEIFQMMRGLIGEAVSAADLAYHNYSHAFTVEERVIRLAHEAGCSLNERRLLRLAALMHDIFHSGNLYRQGSGETLEPDLSNEEFAVIKGDQLLGEYLSVSERLQLQALILATSFGQTESSPVPKPEWVRAYAPETKLERLLAFADINVMEGTFVQLLQDAFSVSIERDGIDNLMSHEGLFKELHGFLGFVQMRMESIKDDIETKSYERYAELYQVRMQQVQQIQRPGSAEHILCKVILKTYDS